MPDTATIHEIIGGGVGVVSLVLLAFFFWLQMKERSANANERKATMDAIESIATKASEALDRNTSAISKLESAVEKLESRLDEHDRVLERVGMNRGL